MVVREACPACGSERCKRNGPLHTGQQNHHGQACGRPLVLHADNRVIGEAQRIVMERLRGENTALPGLCQAVGITIRWLMRFLVARCAALPDHLSVPPAAAPWEGSLGRLEVEADAMVSGVTTKATTSWGWIAMDTQTRHIMAFHVGDRRHERAKPLWAPLPAVSRVWVTFATDQSPVYTGIMPAAQHQAITTQARTTPPLERFTNTMRQRISRLVRDTLAFATPLAHPLGAITSFLCHSHRTRAAAFLVEHDP